MIALLKARMGATLPMIGAGLLPAAPALAQGAATDLFLVEADSAGDTRTGLFQMTPDRRGFRGMVRKNDPSARDAYADYYTAEKTSNKADSC
ncbi:hypothetical protein PIB19_12590 [Sphingomonas sp. 7/4-4]|uniref:hypothetical protein n=1 Tax=Sphingomonas sp. 7/4-4 TaxID=3018446 RepID=UPI0022F383C3|nr:hypothetical protein [Sphingomonas sp. 7/4-4]WBY06434.1 hypothetical protein PIB19_12590 [Sphingomonas sp. 7/4-4]